MSDRRPDCVYGILVREGKVFLTGGAEPGLPGGAFPPLAADRKEELRAHLLEQLGIVARATWAQGAFDYRHPAQPAPRFSGFYTVWDWDGMPRAAAGCWFSAEEIAASPLDPSLKILLTSVLETRAIRTT